MTTRVKLPRTALGRSARLLSGGANILARELAGRVRSSLGGDKPRLKTDLLIAQAEQLVATLGSLKGAAMKAGQILSLEIGDMLPAEVVDILRRLHDDAPAMDFATVEAVLRRELGPERLAQLEDLSREPLAAASIGQVHAARVAGREVVVKVQFPGVAQSIDADLNVLRQLAQTVLTLQGKAIALDDLFAELARGLKNEVDYEKEAAMLAAYKEAFAAVPAYVIPTVVSELSTKHVLTMSRERGQRIQDWLREAATQDERNAFGGLIVDLLLREFFDHGLVQTDPNYGNFLYRPETGQLVLLDFGAVQRYAASFRDDYRDILGLALENDRDGVLDKTIAMQLMDAREAPEIQALLADLIALVARMFDPVQQPFDFGNLSYLEETRLKLFAFASGVRHSPPPKQIAFLNRKLGGMYHLLKDAGCRLDLAPFAARVLKAQ